MIHGERVTLRPWHKGDLDAVRHWHDDSEVMQFWGNPMPLVTEGYMEEGLQPGGRATKFDTEGHFIICDETARPIGQVSFLDYSPRHRHAELSILIGVKEYWSKGYGSEAIIAFGHWYFNEKGAHRLWLTVLASNTRAQRAYEKVGFVREGIWREQVFMDGGWTDEHLYGLLRPEFNTRYRPDLGETPL